jgi:predicted Zn-dependent protease with MMP-like domain
MTSSRRRTFDRWVDRVIAALPPRVAHLLEEAPLVVEDRPSPALLDELGLDPREDLLCGLHTGTPLTERSVQRGSDLPEMIQIFREDIVETAGGWHPWQDEEGTWWGGARRIREQIRITILHEIGHHFGLEEQDLEGLGYG